MLAGEACPISTFTDNITAMFSNFNDMVTVPELAVMLNVGRNTAYELVRAGIVPSVKIGRQIRISKQSVIGYITRSEMICSR